MRNILEVGAGTGSNLSMLQGFGWVDAIEPDEAARALASRRGGIAVGGGLLPDRVELPDGRYDMIVLLDVLEHIENDRGSLQVLKRKLAPGGRLVLTVPAAPWLWSSARRQAPPQAPLHASGRCTMRCSTAASTSAT